VIPRVLRDRIGMSAGEVEVTVTGSAVQVEPVISGEVIERDGLLVIATAGPELTADDVRELRLADQR